MRYLLRHAPISIRQYVLISTLTVIALVLVVLGLTGRLPLIAAVGGAILPFLGRLVNLLRLIPLVRMLTGQGSWLGGRGSGPATAGNQSRVRTRFIAMVLDHDSGKMDGEVLEGKFRGRRLSELHLPELLELLTACSIDTDSGNVLHAYLDRTEPGWRDRAGERDSEGTPHQGGQGTMDEKHALEILGLSAGASRDEIVAAHRKLMQKLHPDRGGSTYLAARINEAKDYLLRDG